MCGNGFQHSHSLPSMGVDHGGDGGDESPPPRIWGGGDANANCPPPPDFVMFQNFQHLIACIRMQENVL